VLGAGFRVVVERGQSIGADVAVEDEKANARVHDSVPGAVRRLGAHRGQDDAKLRRSGVP